MVTLPFRPLVHSAVTFRRLPTSIVLVVVYALLFAGVLVSDRVPGIPHETLGLDLEEAYLDLHQIAHQPHPLNSHANELVRNYILGRLQQIAKGFSYIQVVDDLVSNGSWVTASHGVSFEGSNILVKVEGTDPSFSNMGGVLFSAHFDSVSTAPGVTDDGIGVATLIQFVNYLASHRTRRTAVFNINNGEEDGLNGAHAFLQHPWSTIPDTFLNLEGAAAGGRPLLFRATSTAPVLSFKNNQVPHPHGNVLSADAFSRGVVASGTDFSVYNRGLGGNGSSGMEGIDFAFYQGRSKYHTKYDSLPGANGAKESLWAMMETVRGAGMALLDEDRTHVGDGGASPPVYFDLFGRSFVVFTQRSLYIFNITMLVLGPLILLILIWLPPIVDKVADTNGNDHDNAAAPPSTGLAQVRRVLSETFTRSSNNDSIWTSLKELRWTKTVWWNEQYAKGRAHSPAWGVRAWRWGKFWVALILGLILQVILVATVLSANSFIVYSQPLLVLSSMLTLAYLTIIFVLQAPFPKGGPRHPDQQKLTMLLQTYILSWILLVLGTVALKRLQIGGTYFLTGWNIFVFLGCVSALFERLLLKSKTRLARPEPSATMEGEESEVHQSSAQSKPGSIREIEGDQVGPSSSTTNLPQLLRNGGLQRASRPTERTPLLSSSRGHGVIEQEESGAIGWWILQLALVIPIPVVLLSHILLLFVEALNQTLSDGNSPVIVYGAMALLSFLIVLPIAPFSFKIHRWVTTILFLTFIITTIYNWAAFPFSQEAPLKVFFQQRIIVNLNDASQAPTSVLTTLTGAKGYLRNRIVSQIPSSWGQDVDCSQANAPTTTGRLAICAWKSDLLPSPIKSNSTVVNTSTWITANATRLSSTSARLSVKGVNTRSCRVYFDTPITSFNVYEVLANGTAVPSSSPMQPAYPIPPEGLTAIWMTSRTWGREFTVDVSWALNSSSPSSFSGQIGCEWSEYESGTLGLSGLPANVTGSIPAFEEVLTYLPKWAAATKLSEGLVEVLGGFSI